MDVKLGQLINKHAQRDAVHVALFPAVNFSDSKLLPGQQVQLVSGSECEVEPATGLDWIGIVDPFLEDRVSYGEWFYVCLKPGTVTGLRHHYTHPQLDSTDRRIIAEVAATCLVTSDELMAAAACYNEEGGEPTCSFNNEHHKDVSQSQWQDFWKAFERITGNKVKHADNPYYCSCG